MEDETAPHHVVFDCATGATTHTVLIEKELNDMRARQAEHDQRRADEAAEEQALRDAVAAHPDPVVQALAKRAGLA